MKVIPNEADALSVIVCHQCVLGQEVGSWLIGPAAAAGRCEPPPAPGPAAPPADLATVPAELLQLCTFHLPVNRWPEGWRFLCVRDCCTTAMPQGPGGSGGVHVKRDNAAGKLHIIKSPYLLCVDQQMQDSNPDLFFKLCVVALLGNLSLFKALSFLFISSSSWGFRQKLLLFV